MPLVLMALLIGMGHAQARSVYCASDSEATKAGGGYYQLLTGSNTKMFKDSRTHSGQWATDWRGPLVPCDAAAPKGCVLGYARADSYRKTTVTGLDIDLAGVGGQRPVPSPVGMFNFSTQNTTTETWDPTIHTPASAGDQMRPVAKHEWLTTEGHFTGAYTYAGEQSGGCHAYVFNPNHEFGHWSAEVADTTRQAWELAT